MCIRLIGLVIEVPFGRRYEIRVISDHLSMVERATGTTAFRSEPCPSDKPARDEWLWRCSDEMAAVQGKASRQDDGSGMLHDWLEQLDLPNAAP